MDVFHHTFVEMESGSVYSALPQPALETRALVQC